MLWPMPRSDSEPGTNTAKACDPETTSLAVPCFCRAGSGYTGVAWDRRKHAIYEGPAVKPVGAEFVGRSSSATSSSPSASVDLPSVPIEANDFKLLLFCTTSSEPEAEGDQQTPSCDSSSWADVALRSTIYSGSFPKGRPMQRNSKDAAIHPGDGSVKITAVMACFGVVFRSRHVHLDRLNGSRITHALGPLK